MNEASAMRPFRYLGIHGTSHYLVWPSTKWKRKIRDLMAMGPFTRLGPFKTGQWFFYENNIIYICAAFLIITKFKNYLEEGKRFESVQYISASKSRNTRVEGQLEFQNRG